MFRETKNRIKDLDEVNPAFLNPFIPGIKNKKPAIILMVRFFIVDSFTKSTAHNFLSKFLVVGGSERLYSY